MQVISSHSSHQRACFTRHSVLSDEVKLIELKESLDRPERERLKIQFFRQLSAVQSDGQTDIVTPRAPDGAKKALK